MDKIQIFQKCKSYIEMLSKQINPITGKVCEDEILKQTEIIVCFKQIAELLESVINNGGEVVKLDAPKPFMVDEVQKENIQILDSPVTMSKFVNQINSTIDKTKMKKITPSKIYNWVVEMGYINKSTEQIIRNKTVYSVNEKSKEIGIEVMTKTDKKTGEVIEELGFSSIAQKYIIDNIDAVVNK